MDNAEDRTDEQPEGEATPPAEESPAADASDASEGTPAPAEEPAAPAEEPAPAEPVAEEAAAPADEAAAPAEEPLAPAEETLAEAEAVEADAVVEEDEEEVKPAPREKPEIPGADLEPDIVPEGQKAIPDEQPLYTVDGVDEPVAEAESESDEDSEEEPAPIRPAAIELAADARYIATGKRKTAIARVILKPGTGEYTINGRPLDEYFPRATLRKEIRQPLETVGLEARMDVIARMHGGGISSQAGALRHGISRALIEADPNLRGELKRRGFLTRDQRVKERKKAGLKKARKRPQFSKR
jgi:small subunit ribosomal protein S9